MADVKYLVDGGAAIISTPSGSWKLGNDNRLYDPLGRPLAIEDDLDNDNTKLQAEIDAINGTLQGHTNSLNNHTDRLNGIDTTIISDEAAINNRVRGDYGLSTGYFGGYAALLANDHLAFCFKDSTNQDVWKNFRTLEDTDTLFDQKVNKAGDTMTGPLSATRFYTGSLDSYTDHTDIYYASRRTSFQTDGNIIVYGTDNSWKTTIMDGVLWSSGSISSGGNIYAKDIFKLTSSQGSNLNELDMHMDADGIVRFYAQNGVSNGFKQFLAFNPNGNLDLYAPSGLFFNGQQVFSPSHMGSGSGLDADLLDGIDSSGFVQTHTPSTMYTDLFMGGWSIYNQKGYGQGNARIQFESNNHITFINDSGNIAMWVDTSGNNQSLHVNDTVTSAHLWTDSMHSDTAQTDFYYASRRTSFQVDGNNVWYGTDGNGKTSLQDGHFWTLGHVIAEQTIRGKDMFILLTSSGSSSNELDMHMDADGIVRFYAQNGVSNGFKQFLAFNPNGNLDLYAPSGLFFNGQQVFSPSHMGSGSGLDADLLDGIDSSGYVHTNSTSTMNTDLIMNNYALYTKGGGARLQLESNNHISIWNSNGQAVAWFDADGANQSLHVNDAVSASHFYNGSLDCYNNQTFIKYAGRQTAFQGDGNTVWYRTDGSVATTIQDGHIWTLGHLWLNQEVSCETRVKATDMFVLTTSQGSNLNEMDMHMDADGVWRVYVQNGVTNGFKQPINYVPTGNFDLYGAGGLFYNGHTLWHNGNQGSGSGLDADLLDGRDSTDFASASDRNNLQNQINNINTTVAANSGSSRLQSWGVDGGVATRVDDKVTLYLYYSTTANRITYPVTFKQVLSIQQSAMMYDGNVTAAYIESYDNTSVKVSAWARWGGRTHGVNTAFFLTVVGTV